jgi:hypothetical protein
MPGRFRWLTLPLLTTLSAATTAQPSAAQSGDTLPRRLTVAAQTVPLRVGGLCEVRLAPAFAYIGGQRFVLQGVADAEQHFFVAADSSRTIHRAVWLQAEEILPDHAGGYDYSSDSSRTVSTLQWAVNLRSNRGDPRPGSDGAAMLGYLTARGYRFPRMGPRLRLVYLPEPRGRREVMIIYLEALEVAAPDTSLDGVLARAQAAIRVGACR